ncbi:MAG: LruC domain-containing protein [Bacteroidales bacterium]|nr:LruC domain-containing protein [Bacteroidales bacterium]
MKKILYILLSLAMMLLLTECNKFPINDNDDTNDDTNNTEVSEMGGLNVSNEFDWKLSHEVSILIDNPLTGTLMITSLDRTIIYYKENCKEAQAQYHINITIPDYVEKILVNNVIYNINGTNGEKATNITAEELANHYNLLKNFKGTKSVSFGSEYVFNSALSYDLSSAALDATHFVVTYRDNWNSSYGTAIIGTISGNTITWGSEFVFNAAGTASISVATLDATHFVVTYSDFGNSQYGTAIVGTVSGNSISWGAEFTLPLHLWSAGVDYISSTALDATHFVFSFRDIGNTYAGTSVIGIITGTNIAWGSENIFNSGNTPEITSVCLSSSAFVLGYRDNGNSQYGTSIAGTVAGNVISFGSEYVFNSAITANPSLGVLNSSKIVVAFRDVGNFDNGTAMIGNVAGNVITWGAEYIFNNAISFDPSITAMDADNFIVAYRDAGNLDVGTVGGGSVTGDVIIWDSDDIFNPSFTNSVTTTTLDATHMIISYSDHGNMGYGTSIFCIFSPLVDTDSDGVADGDDDYPTDPLRAYDNYFPTIGYGTLAFEDLWTSTGDYDFNDVVIDYRFQTVTNASNEVVEIFGNFVTKALGAGHNNSFGFNLPNANATLINNLTVTGYDFQGTLIDVNASGLEIGQTHPTIIVFDQSFGFAPLVNTFSGFAYETPDTTTIKMVPSATYIATDFALSTFNPFVIIHQTRGRELHLPDYEPTDLIDISFYQTWNDDTQPGIDKYFKTATNLPWGINIPESFAYPFEYADITTAFTHFQAWAESSGSTYSDWYQDKPGYRNNVNIYTQP